MWYWKKFSFAIKEINYILKHITRETDILICNYFVKLLCNSTVLLNKCSLGENKRSYRTVNGFSRWLNPLILLRDKRCSLPLCYMIQSSCHVLHEPTHQWRPCQQFCHLRARTPTTADRCHSLLTDRFTVLRTWRLRCWARVKVTLKYASTHNKTELTLSHGDTWIAQYNIELRATMTKHTILHLPWDKSVLQTKSEAFWWRKS